MHGNGGAAMSAVADVGPALMGYLKDLRLPTVRECYEDTARRAERETLSYEQYLWEVISRECEQRRLRPYHIGPTTFCRAFSQLSGERLIQHLGSFTLLVMPCHGFPSSCGRRPR
jgi:hypothetical protein